jgi:superfamily II DNA helicase RecQ
MKRRRKSKSSIHRVVFSIISWLILAPFKILKWIFVKKKSSQHIDADGYVYLPEFKTTEHRHIASQLLGRNLLPNEVIHHINGSKTDNRFINLCLMDREKHEHFHAWLNWQKSKKSRYPKIPDQKNVLETEYGGTLLEKIAYPKNRQKTNKTEVTKFYINLNKPTHQFKRPEKITEIKNSKKKLFKELKKERLKLAKENQVPAYIIFHDVTLNEIAEVMPVSKSLMLQIQGVGPEKVDKYGDRFIEIVRSFKSNLEDESA